MKIDKQEQLEVGKRYSVFDEKELLGTFTVYPDGFLVAPANKGEMIGFNPAIFFDDKKCCVFEANLH